MQAMTGDSLEVSPRSTEPRPKDDRFLTALTTEHFTLQGARAATISEAGARSSLFMSTVSSAVVALALIGTITDAGTIFNLFALALMPVLFALGLLTYLRLSETAIEDVFYGRAINRIRHYYAGLDPARAAYLGGSISDDLAGVMASSGHRLSAWHLLSHTATMVLVVTGVIAGTGTGLLLYSLAPGRTGLSAAVGAIIAVATIAVLFRHEASGWRRAAGGTVMFPSSNASGAWSSPVAKPSSEIERL